MHQTNNILFSLYLGTIVRLLGSQVVYENYVVCSSRSDPFLMSNLTVYCVYSMEYGMFSNLQHGMFSNLQQNLAKTKVFSY